MRMKPKVSLLSLIVMFLILFSVGIVVLAALGQFFGIPLSKPCIAEVKIDHQIVDSADEGNIFSPQPPPTAKEIIELIDEANSREDVAAIVIYIDSPGGEVIPSREIYEHIRDSEKPTVAYLRSIATSGGYYVAAGSDYIVSEPETITGSIGARATFISMQSLFGKLGVNYTTVKSGKYKDIGDVGRNLTKEEQEIIQGLINEVFDEFKQSVYESRKGKPYFSDESFSKVLDARIISGREAYKLGLVDELGNEQAAYDKAAELAGISDYKTCEMSPKKGILRSFIEDLAKPINLNVNINIRDGVGLAYS